MRNIYMLACVGALVLAHSLAGAWHMSAGLRVAAISLQQQAPQLTFSAIRAKTPSELEALTEAMEADAATAVDKVDLGLSRNLAVAHSCLRDFERAAWHAKAAMQSGEPDAEMHFVLGLEAEHRDAQDEALDEYEAAVALDPQCWRALFHVGKIALQYGWAEDAIEYFRRVATINPEHAPTQAFLARLEEMGVDADEVGEVAPPETLELPDGINDIQLD